VNQLPASLRVDGRVACPVELTREALAELPDEWQVADVSRIDPARRGRAVRLAALLDLVQVASDATHLGLHGTRDDFHASIPLEPVRQRALVIYQLDGQPLPVTAGGPFRFYIPDHAACHADEIDECANVKFLDRIELTCGKGHDNRPQDEASHAKLHQQ
jgi:DMSO/TMAO reductase YedYZ molybdopterin-dependent catalytic subunit